MTYEPLHHKYRPQTFADLVGQDAIAITLSQAIRTERIAPAYLFAGPRGTGKTSSARILAKSLNCLRSDRPTEKPCGVCEVCRAIARGSALDVLEIDAASNTGVDNIRELIERAQFAPVQCRYKVYVLDEVHMLSTPAFNALLKTLEEPPDRVVFVLATTDPQRVLPTIISRCQRFDFRRIALKAMVAHLGGIAIQENINIAEDAIHLLAQIAQGGLRDAESLLDQLSLFPGQITIERVWGLVGMVPEQDLMALLGAIADNQPETVLDQARHLMDQGYEPLAVLQNLAGFYRDLLIAKTAPSRADLVTLTPPTWTKFCNLAQELDISVILAGQQHLRACEVQVKSTTQPRLWLEVTLLGLLPAPDNHQLVGLNSTVHAPATSLKSGDPPTRVASAVREQQPKTSGTQPSIPQLKQNANATASHPPVVEQPSDSGALLVTSVSTNGASQDQGTQPAQVEASIHASEPEPATSLKPGDPPTQVSSTLPSSRVSKIEAPEPISDQPPPAQSRVEGSSHNDRESSTAVLLSGGTPPTDCLTEAAPAFPQTEAEPAESSGLDQVWRSVINHLQPFSTQALLDQLCHLVAFDGQHARVGIRSRSWLKTAQEKLPNIEAAFQVAFQRGVKVSIEVASPSRSRAPSEHEQQTPTAPTSVDSENSVKASATRPIAEATQFTTSQSSAEAFPQTLNSSATQTPAWEEDDEVKKAAKSLAQFFNGEVVSQENELVPGSIENELVSGSMPPGDDLYPSGRSQVDSPKDDLSQADGEDEIPF